MRWILGLGVLAALAGIGYLVYTRLTDTDAPARERMIAPVSAAPIDRGPIALRRTSSGTLESSARFVVAPKVAGRVARLTVDLADPVERGQVVALLDAAEFEQAVEQAKADLAVAEANITEARSTLQITERELERITALGGRGVISASTADTAKAEKLAGTAAVAVARAQARRAQASLEAARIRLSYTRITADWPESVQREGGADREGSADRADTGRADTGRVVAERFVDAGETISANTPLLTIVDLDPLTGVIYVTEKDYPRLAIGQPVEIVTDAWPDRTFAARIHRIAPVFRETSRQARIELRVDNADRALRPGMFIRATITLEVVDDATTVPIEALVMRGDRDGVFVIDPDGRTVHFRAVELGIRDGDRVQVTGDGLTGRVVTLGQQLLDEGSPVKVTDKVGAAPAAPAPGPPAAPAPEAPR